MKAPLLDVRDLTVTFGSRGSPRLEAVRGIDLAVDDGELHGVVGESGSGKSVTMLAMLGLLPPNVHVTGSVKLRGEELLGRPQRFLRRIRGARIGYIFQDPMTALNPLITVGDQLMEAVRIHQKDVRRREARERALELLRLVSIPSPEQRIDQYPHEFSGGMRQRAVIALAMANDPELLIADEPTTALDVTIQAQIMELLQRLRTERGVGLILVTHDLAVVAGAANRISIMYAGRVVEHGSIDATFKAPVHPYTRGLIGSLPRLDERVACLSAIPGTPPAIGNRPSGCSFHPRCPHAIPACEAHEPRLRDFGGSKVACDLAESLRKLDGRAVQS